MYCHLINENEVDFKGLFKPDTIYRGCDFCHVEFENARSKNNHMFLFHHGQMGGNSGNGQLPVNILKRGPITYYNVTYEQHKIF